MIATLLFILSTATAAPPNPCAGISSDLDRLACYDRQSGRTPRERVIAPAPSSAWKSHESVSALTDRKDIFLSVESREPVSCRWSKYERIRLVIRCADNTTAIVFNTQCHMASSDYNDYGVVEYRIGDGKAAKVRMVASTSNDTLGLWTGARSIPLIKQMFGQQRLVARMTPYGDNPVMAEFDITGLEESIAPLRKECGW